MALGEKPRRTPSKRESGELRSTAKQQHIVAAATSLFLRHGYAMTSMDAIAREAAVSKQTVYSYFPSKDELFSHVVSSQCLRHSPSEEMLSRPETNVSDALLDIGSGFLSMISSPEGLAIHRLVMAEAERRPQLAAIFFESGPMRMQRMLETFLVRQVEKGTIVTDDVAAAAAYFFALLKGRYHLRMALRVKPLPSRAELERHIADTVRVFLKLYRE